ncbi:MAG: hypothetical protein N3I35_05350 [Clostridia bacterium]|nr:hypothetical protein [Clostridia bacterium]
MKYIGNSSSNIIRGIKESTALVLVLIVLFSLFVLLILLLLPVMVLESVQRKKRRLGW